MYDRNLGFWSELFSAGASIIKNVAPTVISASLQARLQSQLARQQSAAQQTALTQIPQQAPIYYPQSTSVIPGVSNTVLFGGFALIALVLIMRRR